METLWLLHAFQEPLEAIDMLQDLVTLDESVEAAVVVYLLGDILNDFNSTSMSDQEQLIEVPYILDQTPPSFSSRPRTLAPLTAFLSCISSRTRIVAAQPRPH